MLFIKLHSKEWLYKAFIVEKTIQKPNLHCTAHTYFSMGAFLSTLYNTNVITHLHICTYALLSTLYNTNVIISLPNYLIYSITHLAMELHVDLCNRSISPYFAVFQCNVVYFSASAVQNLTLQLSPAWGMWMADV